MAVIGFILFFFLLIQIVFGLSGLGRIWKHRLQKMGMTSARIPQGKPPFGQAITLAE